MLHTFTATLKDAQKLTDSVSQFTFAPNDHQLSFQAGQYAILHIPIDGGKTARRLYSMSSSPAQTESFDLIVEIVPDGVASTHLSTMRPGDSLTVQAPAGMFMIKDPSKPTVFLATGTGIAPIKSMIHQLLEIDQVTSPITLAWGFQNYADTYLFEEFKALQAKHPTFQVQYCLSRQDDLSCITDSEDRSLFALGHVQDSLDKRLENPLIAYHYYLCGGPKVVDALKTWTEEQGIPKEQVHFEKFTA